MPKNLTPQDQWETEFQVPLPGEPRNIGPLETLFQRLLNRTERLRNRIGSILGLPWDADPPATIAGLHNRVTSLEGGTGGVTMLEHRTNPVLDHPDGSVTAAKLAPGAVVGNLGFTPANRAGDTMTGQLVVPSLRIGGGRLLHVYVDHGNDAATRYYLLAKISNQAGILAIQGILGGHIPTEGRANVNLQIAFQDGLRVDGHVLGGPGASDILIVDGNDGYAYVYLITETWALVNLELSVVGLANILYDGAYSTTAPTGTQLYRLSDDYNNNTHPHTLKLRDGKLVVQSISGAIDFTRRFVVQANLGGTSSGSIGGNYGIQIYGIRVAIGSGERLYLKRLRFRLSPSLVAHVANPPSYAYFSSTFEGDIELDVPMSDPGPGLPWVQLNIKNNSSAVIAALPNYAIWAEMEIR